MDTPSVSLPTSLEQAKISKLPSCAYYIPNFISGDEETVLLDKVGTLVHKIGPLALLACHVQSYQRSPQPD